MKRDELEAILLETDILIKQCQEANDRLDKILSGEDDSGVLVGICSRNQADNKKPVKN